MKTSEIKKGTRVILRNGFEAKTLESARKTTCLCEVYGIVTEAGSVYSHDIVGYQNEEGNWCSDVEYSKSQMSCQKMARMF